MTAEHLEAGLSGQNIFSMDTEVEMQNESNEIEEIETMNSNTTFEAAIVMDEDDSNDDENEDEDIDGEQNSREKAGKKMEKKRKKSASVGVRYPTQYMMVGEIHCIFLSWYNRGRSPLLTLGPSYPFTAVLLLLACMITGFLELLLWESQDRPHPMHKLWCQACVGFNVILLFTGILKNPGIPQRLIDRLLKEQQGKGEAVEMEDLESASTSRDQRTRRDGHNYCSYCKLENGKEDLYHCDDCDVCIVDCDHHCVFFSKCIGGGNIACFWGSLGGVIFNFLNIAIMLGVSA